MDKQTALTLHREMWTWLSENPKMQKWNWPRWGFHGGDVNLVTEYCFCCEISSQCSNCLVEWPGGKCELDTGDGLYEEWNWCETRTERAQLALKIANLPENKDFKANVE